MKPETKKLVGILCINSILFIALYFWIATFFPPILFIYLAAGAGLALYYVIYNRGFVGKNTTPDMLPASMSLDEKQAFLENCRQRAHRSRWVMTLLIPLILTFAAEMIYLFLWPMLQEIFG